MLKKIEEIKEKITGGIKTVKEKGTREIALEAKKYVEDWLFEHRDKLQNLERTNYELAIHHFNHGNLSDAAMRFKIVRKFWKNSDPKIDYYLGRIYTLQMKYKPALKHLNAYTMSGERTFFAENDFSIKIAENNLSAINAIPIGIIRSRFEQNSNRSLKLSRRQLRQHFERKAMVAELLKRLLPYTSKPHDSNIADLDCGEGALGVMLRENIIFNLLLGADYAPNNLRLAKTAKRNAISIYNELVTISESNGLEKINQSGKYNVAIISEMLNYSCEPITVIKRLNGFDILIICFRGDDFRQNFRQKTDDTSGKNGTVPATEETAETADDIAKKNKPVFNRYREDFTFCPETIKQQLADETAWHLVHEVDAGEVALGSKDTRRNYIYVLANDSRLIEKCKEIYRDNDGDDSNMFAEDGENNHATNDEKIKPAADNNGSGTV